MAHPIFFSVASNDVALAERLYNDFAGGLIYLYSQNGENGAWLWDEIERDQLPFAEGIVIFWSKSYLSNEGTRREIEFASKLFTERRLRECAIIRLDETPLFPDGDAYSDEEKAVFAHLRPFLAAKRSDPLKQVYPEAARLIDNLVGKIAADKVPFQRRPMVQDDLRDAAKVDRKSYYPAFWVSGYNGYGRKTLVRELVRELNPNLVEIPVDIDETSLPEQIILRILSEFRGLEITQLRDEAEKYRDAKPADVATIVEQLASQSRYILFRQSRLFEESVALPEWIEDLIANLATGKYPKLVVVSNLPASDERLTKLSGKLGAYAVPAMRPETAEEFAWAVANFFERPDQQWGEPNVARVAQASAGTPELIITIIKLASRLQSLNELEEIIGKEKQRFSDTLSHLIDWAIERLGETTDERRVLLFLNDVSPVSLEDIQAFLRIEAPAIVILNRLVTFGLVERSREGLFRVSPLLSNRLGTKFTAPSLLRRHRREMEDFASRPLEVFEGEHGYVRIEAKIKSELSSGRLEVSEDVKSFVSFAHYLQIGIRLYADSRFNDALPLLQVAFENRNVFSLNASIEACRFYGLACVRNDEPVGFGQAVAALRSRHQGQSMADFLEAEKLSADGKHREAIPFYRKAQQHAQQAGDGYREERILRPYIDAILSTWNPNLDLAKELADRNVVIRRTLFSLWMRARVYLKIFEKSDRSSVGVNREAYHRVLKELENDTGGYGFYCRVRSEEAELWEEYDEAIEWAEAAYEHDQRFDLKLRLWGVKFRSSDLEIRKGLAREIEEFCRDRSNRTTVRNFSKAIVRRYAQALGALGELKQFRLVNLRTPLKLPEVRKIFLEVSGRR